MIKVNADQTRKLGRNAEEPTEPRKEDGNRDRRVGTGRATCGRTRGCAVARFRPLLSCQISEERDVSSYSARGIVKVIETEMPVSSREGLGLQLQGTRSSLALASEIMVETTAVKSDASSAV